MEGILNKFTGFSLFAKFSQECTVPTLLEAGGGGECVTHSGSAIPLGKEITVKSSVTATLL